MIVTFSLFVMWTWCCFAVNSDVIAFTCFIGVPNIPGMPMVTERRIEGALELSWDSMETEETGPVLYIIYCRWNVGKRPFESQMTPWQQRSQVCICHNHTI